MCLILACLKLRKAPKTHTKNKTITQTGLQIDAFNNELAP